MNWFRRRTDHPNEARPATARWYADLLRILGKPTFSGREQLLRYAVDLLPGSGRAALLWLFEESRHIVALNKVACDREVVARPELLLDTVLVGDRQSAMSMIAAQTRDKLALWIKDNGIGSHELLLPIETTLNNGERVVTAFVQLLAPSEIPTELGEDMRLLCEGISILLSRSRDERKLRALEMMRANATGNNTADWSQRASDALVHAGRAEACMVFRDLPGGVFASVAVTPPQDPPFRLVATSSSVIKRVAESRTPARVLDFTNKPERESIFGNDTYDKDLRLRIENEILHSKIRSVLMAPVIFEDHTIAVIVLLNKRADAHLARIFSQTDEEVLTSVCDFFSGVLPSIETYEAIKAMDKAVLPDSLNDDAEKAKLFTMLAATIPGITGAALVRKRVGHTLKAEVLGGEVFTADISTLLKKPGTLLPATSNQTGERHYLTTLIAGLRDPCWLTIEVARSYLSGYELQIISFFCKELHHVLLAQQELDDVIDKFLQMRHALRSGLTGVVGYVHEAQSCFEQYQRLNFAPSFLSQARFRKALQRAHFATAKTQLLLEESRFLLNHVSQANLRLGNHSFSGVVRSVIDTLRPSAEERRIEIQYNNTLPPELDQGAFDRTLIEMLIFNIVDNAIKYSHRNKAISVATTPAKSDWRLEVVDHGTFIRAEDRDAIFLPFTRRPTGQAADTRPGTGLGLAIGKEIAEAHLGNIDCSSVKTAEDLAETSFVIRIPRGVSRES